MDKFCTWKNIPCGTYRCCSFCKKESCLERCKDDPNNCKYILNSEPEWAKKIAFKKPEEPKKLQVESKPIENQPSQVEEKARSNQDQKKLARKLRREERKKRLKNGNL